MATPKQNKASQLPEEYQNLARVEDVSALDEKVQNCYSKDRYKDFQDDVKTIVLDVIGNSDGRKKIKEHAKESAKEYNEEQGWKNKQFWIPTIIASLTAIGTIIVAIKAF